MWLPFVCLFLLFVLLFVFLFLVDFFILFYFLVSSVSLSGDDVVRCLLFDFPAFLRTCPRFDLV